MFILRLGFSRVLGVKRVGGMGVRGLGEFIGGVLGGRESRERLEGFRGFLGKRRR